MCPLLITWLHRTEAKTEQHLGFNTMNMERLTKLSRYALKAQFHPGRTGYSMGKKAQSFFSKLSIKVH